MKDISKKIRPTSDRVLIKEDSNDKEKKTASGIIIPVGSQDNKGSKSGVIVAIGPGRTEDGKTIPVAIKVGDKVLFQWGDKISAEGEEYYIVREQEILAVLK